MSHGSKVSLDLGANYGLDGATRFKVWAPRPRKVQLELKGKRFEMKRDRNGYWTVTLEHVKPGDTYFYCLEGSDLRPDPASRFQPKGVHGPSAVIDPSAFKWTDQRYKGINTKDLILYELHIGTFTKEGTFEAAIKKIPYLKKLGVTCIEVMPVAQFPGKRNWGYDGVGLYACQNSYGGPNAFKKFVNAAHAAKIGVCLDVVYNHFGPEGNYLHAYGPYFTHKYHTPWGDAVNYDDHASKFVRHFISENALYWVREYHLDALRLDAIHGIYDKSKKHILLEINEKIKRYAKKINRPISVIAESDMNEAKVVSGKNKKGYGFSSMWSDDFHHSMHRTLTGETKGYFCDYDGLNSVSRAVRHGQDFQGAFSVYRGKKFGTRVKHLPAEKFVFCLQNHDQIGNRGLGDRLTQSVGQKELKAAAALLLLTPYLPLLYMGEEYAEKAPFQYFIDHGDPELREAVRNGRKAEFHAFGWKHFPDPASVKTYNRSKLKWASLKKEKHQYMLQLYRDLIALRKTWLKQSFFSKKTMVVTHIENADWLSVKYKKNNFKDVCLFISFSKGKKPVQISILGKSFKEKMSTGQKKYGGQQVRLRTHRDTIFLPSKTALIGELTHG